MRWKTVSPSVCGAAEALHARNSSSFTLTTLWNLLLYKNPAQNPQDRHKDKTPIAGDDQHQQRLLYNNNSFRHRMAAAELLSSHNANASVGRKQLCLLALCEESSGCLHGELSGRDNEKGGGGGHKKKKNRLTEAITHNIRSALVPVSVEVLLERIIPGDSISLSSYCCCFCCCNRMQLHQCQHEHHHYHNKSCSQPPTAAAAR